jgi:tetratricopeptide (TPR) repeat protein
MGTADRRFDVRSFTAGAATSDLILTSGESRTIDPPTRLLVRPDQGLNAYFEVYGQTATRPLAAVDILSAADNRVRAAVQATVSAEAGRHVARARLPIDSLPAGRYVARVRLTDTAGAGTVSRSFELGDGGAASVPGPPAFRFDVAGALRDARVAAYRESLAAGTSDVDRRASSVFSVIDQGAFADAVATLNELVRLAPDTPQLPFLLGVAHAALGDDRSAIGAWRLTVQLDQRWLEAHLALADACMRLDQPELAQQALHTAVRIMPEAEEIWERLSAIKP